MKRQYAFQRFIEATRNTFFASCPEDEASAAGNRIFTALETPGRIGRDEPARTLPVCEYLAPAIANARAAGGAASDLADSIETLLPRLAWRRRAGSSALGAAFHDGHANTWIVAPNGLERRDDVIVGATLTAPWVSYPAHSHPPEEIYVVLSDGDWRRDGVDWHTPGIGGTVYNPPGVVHAMRSGPAPLLAVWCLLVESDRGASR